MAMVQSPFFPRYKDSVIHRSHYIYLGLGREGGRQTWWWNNCPIPTLQVNEPLLDISLFTCHSKQETALHPLDKLAAFLSIIWSKRTNGRGSRPGSKKAVVGTAMLNKPVWCYLQWGQILAHISACHLPFCFQRSQCCCWKIEVLINTHFLNYIHEFFFIFASTPTQCMNQF